jgi:hypothetical protein
VDCYIDRAKIIHEISFESHDEPGGELYSLSYRATGSEK